MRASLLLCLFFVYISPVFAQNRIYVNQAVSGGAETGANWGDAFSDLQLALSVAAAGDSIWVAEGIYKPTATIDRTLSFVLVDAVCLYGGFAGTEVWLAERDLEQHPTILSGDIGVPGVRTDNSYHVMRGKGLGDGTLLDGFYIRDGYSYNDVTPKVIDRYGAGMLLEGAPGIADSRPVIQNCLFENNYANHGGGLCITWSDAGGQPQGNNPVNPILRGCTFSRNNAAISGGAMYKDCPPVLDTFTIEDCRFLDNKAVAGQGGGAYFLLTTNSNTIIRRCQFERDTSWGDAGGAISNFADPIDSLNVYSLLLDSCLFRQNLALEGGAYCFDGFTSFILGNNQKVKFDCQMLSCQFIGNKARTSHGSAFSIFVGDGRQLSVEVNDSNFEDNLANGTTAIITFYEHNSSYLKMNRCMFFKNYHNSGQSQLCMAVNHGGGAFNNVVTEINNCIFFHNGGGIAATSGTRNYSITQISNCTFFENNEYTFIKTSDTLFNQPNGYYNDFFIDNCILWEPKTNLRKMFYNNKSSESNMYGYRINHSLLSLKDSTSVPGAGNAFQDGLIWGSFPGFQDSLAGDFRLTTCSPAVNKGNNDIVFEYGLQDDLDGLPRLRYGTVDLGAYEQQDSCESVRIREPSETAALIFWPNPSIDETLHFQLPAGSGGVGLLSLFDAHGREIYQSEIRTYASNIHTFENLAPGMYIVRLYTVEGTFSGKWVKM